MIGLHTGELTTFQLRAARRALGLSFHDVSKETGVAVSALARMESSDLDQFPQHSNVITVYKVRSFLEQRGIEFLSDNWLRLAPGDNQLMIRVKSKNLNQKIKNP